MANRNRVVVDGGYVVTMDPARRVIPGGSIGIEDGRIAAVGTAEEVRVALPDAERINAVDGLVIPGLVDLHHHPIMPVFASGRDEMGLFPPVATNGMWSNGGDIEALLRWAIEPFGAPLTDDEAYVSALAAFASLARSGVTCVIDGGTAFVDAVAQAAIDIGIRAMVVCQSQDLAPGASTLQRAVDPDRLLRSTEDAVARWTGAGDGRIRVAAGLWWPIGCSDELCEGIRDLAERAELPVLTHVAALANESAASHAFHGRTPFLRLDNLGLLGPSLVCAHAGFPTDDEIDRIAATATRIAHVPATSTFGLHGIVSAGTMPRYLDRDVVVGLGTDGSGPRITEYTLAAAASFHKDVTRMSSTLDAPTVLQMATLSGAIAVGWEDSIGSLEVGKRADVVVIDRRGIEWQPDVEPVRAFVEGAGAGNVSHVLVDGRAIVRGGVLATMDEAHLIERLRGASASLASRS
jgi:cytosine/adenosine deaminase-related metal-dependent hydrolase